MEKAIQHVSTIFPAAEFANQAICREYLTHALRLLAGDTGKSIEARYTLCLKVGLCLYNEGRIRESVKWIKESCEWREGNLAEEHPDRLASQLALAGAYQADGHIKKAVELMEHVVDVQGRILAEEHPDRLTSQHVLARAYQADGQIKKAVELMEHVVAVNSVILRKDHPSRLVSESSLSYFLAKQLDDLDNSVTRT
jgi:tetratricopeptide (TPR) repeat protein